MGFFDKLTGTINSAGENVVKMAKDASDISKYNSQIEECRTKIKGIYIEIGKYFWENRQKLEADDMLKQLLLRIENETEKINVLETELRQLRVLRGAEICKKCGAELKKGANFCNVCGTPVERKQEKTLICKNCGAELKGNEKFCMSCGAKIETVKPMPKQQETTIKTCSNCGQELRPDDAFCRFCGTAVSQSLKIGDVGTTEEKSAAQEEEQAEV